MSTNKKNKCKNYLNSAECLDFMMLSSLMAHLDQMVDNWCARQVVSSDESRSLKMANTYVKKFLSSLLGRLDNKEKEKIDRKMKTNTVRLYDRYTIDKLNRESENTLKNTVVDRELFDKFCEEIMDVRCRNCNKEWVDCELHTLFEENLIPEPTGYDCKNCRYAFYDINKNKDIK